MASNGDFDPSQLSAEQQAALEGTGALETLCRVLGSADHIVATLKDWSNEEVWFLLTFA